MLVPCQVSKGLRDQELIVEITDFYNQPQSLPLERDFVVYEAETPFLPVRVLYRSDKDRAALVILPVESDSGAHRVWVRMEGTRETKGEDREP
jgi:hypothetical protein